MFQVANIRKPLLLACFVAHLNTAYACDFSTQNIYLLYLDELKKPINQANTAQFFNLKYLQSEMLDSGIPADEVASRLLGYINELDTLHSSISVKSILEECSDAKYQVVTYRVEGQPLGLGEYVGASYVDSRITGLVFSNNENHSED